MAHDMAERRRAYVAKARAELGELADAGAVMSGNAFAEVLLVKGELFPEERANPSRLLSGVDGDALRAALVALGYAPGGWAALSTLREGSDEPLANELLRRAVATLDPATVIICDEGAARLVREAFADELAAIDDLPSATLQAGAIAHVLGMRLMNLGGFASSLGDPHEKQVMWARLKRLGPLGEPY